MFNVARILIIVGLIVGAMSALDWQCTTDMDCGCVEDCLETRN